MDHLSTVNVPTPWLFSAGVDVSGAPELKTAPFDIIMLWNIIYDRKYPYYKAKCAKKEITSYK